MEYTEPWRVIYLQQTNDGQMKIKWRMNCRWMLEEQWLKDGPIMYKKQTKKWMNDGHKTGNMDVQWINSGQTINK